MNARLFATFLILAAGLPAAAHAQAYPERSVRFLV